MVQLSSVLYLSSVRPECAGCRCNAMCPQAVPEQKGSSHAPGRVVLAMCLSWSEPAHARAHTPLWFKTAAQRSWFFFVATFVYKKILFDFLMVVSSLIYFGVRRARVECDIFATGHCALYLLDLVLISLCTHSCVVLWKGQLFGVNSEEITVGCQKESLFR